LADVLPAIQQGTIDGALGILSVFTTMHYQDVAKTITETGQPWINVMAVLSTKWVDGLPADLQKVVRDDATAATAQIVPFVSGFFAAQRKLWTANGGEFISLPDDEQKAMLARISSIGDDLSKDRPELNKAVKSVFDAASRNK
jgi:TRAP-type transport system periplasmic protein